MLKMCLHPNYGEVSDEGWSSQQTSLNVLYALKLEVTLDFVISRASLTANV